MCLRICVLVCLCLSVYQCIRVSVVSKFIEWFQVHNFVALTFVALSFALVASWPAFSTFFCITCDPSDACQALHDISPGQRLCAPSLHGSQRSPRHFEPPGAGAIWNGFGELRLVQNTWTHVIFTRWQRHHTPIFSIRAGALDNSQELKHEPHGSVNLCK